jgi:5,10-methylenetetrahydromethanopterin reductase
MRIGISFQTNKTPGEYELLGAEVDRHDFAVVTVYNDLTYQPSLGPLLWLARVVRRATLGVSAVNPFTVHPFELAGQAALVDLATDGRAYLGMARGAWLEQIGVEPRRPLRALREATLLIRHVLRRDPAPFDGECFQLAARTVLAYPTMRDRVPISIGAWGPATLRLAGEIADEVKVGGTASPRVGRRARELVAAGERLAGRHIGTVGVCLGAVTVVDNDGEAARRLARQRCAMYLPIVGALDVDSDPEWVTRVTAAATRGDVDAIVALTSDDILRRFAFAGTPDELVRHAEELADAGVERVEFGTPHGADPLAAIRMLGERVVPAFG